jgi:hypothetical protein
MQPADDIKKLIDESQITSSWQVDRRILADALEDLEKRRANQGTGPQPGVWRIVMRSKMTKLAAAAVIVVAVLLGFHFIGSPLGSGVTFAQVIQPILNANTAILDIIIGTEDPNTPVIHDMVVGSRIRRTMSNIEGNVSIIDLESGRILNLTEAKKEAVYIDLKGLPSMPNYMDQLRNALAQLQDSPHFVVEELGTREIDGRKAVGFLAKHPRSEITIWADAKTGLPIRIDQKDGQMLVIAKNLQFDAPMDQGLFSMEVPEGYKLQQMEMDLFGATEADFIEGLRVLAEKFEDGQFPDGVAVEDYLKQAPQITKKFEQLKLSDEEQLSLGKKMQQYLLFTRFFKGEGKWYYRGKGVKLGAAEKPIFWYRPRDSKTYRVIYDDLHVADVAPENLPEPLAADDVAKGSIGYQQWSKPDFVGRQEDLWRITASGQIVAQSDVTLMKGPQGVSVMPITLPYATGVLTSVSLGDAPAPFEQAGAGQYKLQLPLEKLLAGQTKVTCKWTLPLADLVKTDYGYETKLKALVTVVSYRLTVALDPDSGLESAKDPSRSSWVPFSIGAAAEPKAEFGSCGIAVQKRK